MTKNLELCFLKWFGFNEISFLTFFKTLVLLSFALYVQIKKNPGSIYILVQLESLKATVFDVSHQINNELV